MSVLQRIGSFFTFHDEEEGDDTEVTTPPQQQRNVVPLTNAPRRSNTGGTEVSVYSPKTFADVTDLADALRSRQVVIVNMQMADRILLQRVIDFTSGVAYTIDGRIQKLAESLFLIVPSGVTVNTQGLRDSLGGESLLDVFSERG